MIPSRGGSGAGINDLPLPKMAIFYGAQAYVPFQKPLLRFPLDERVREIAEAAIPGSKTLSAYE